jgi:hypothetical protein
MNDAAQWEAEMRRWLNEQIEQCQRLEMHQRAGAFLDCLAHLDWIPENIRVS